MFVFRHGGTALSTWQISPALRAEGRADPQRSVMMVGAAGRTSVHRSMFLIQSVGIEIEPIYDMGADREAIMYTRRLTRGKFPGTRAYPLHPPTKTSHTQCSIGPPRT
jgi:hypothetical protein